MNRYRPLCGERAQSRWSAAQASNTFTAHSEQYTHGRFTRGVLYGLVKTRILPAMVVYLDEPVSARGFELIPNDSPLTELVPPGSSERDRLECVRKLLLVGLEKDDLQLF